MGKKYVIEIDDRPLQDACGIELWKIEKINCYISKSELEKLEEYKESHEFKVGDVCRWKGVLFTRNNKVFIIRITDKYVRFIDKTGEPGSMLRGVFEKSADFVKHLDTFEVLSEE